VNILFVADVSIAEVIGGAERVLYEQSTRLSRRGHHIHILTRKLPTHKKDKETIQNVTEWRYDCNQQNAASFLQGTLRNTKRLFESLNQHYNFECINFHQPFSALGVNHSSCSNSISKIYTCHSLSFEEFSSRDGKANGLIKKASNFLQIQARKKIEKDAISKSDEIVVLSKFTKKKLVDFYNISNEIIKIIPGGVNLNIFKPADDKTTIRKQLNIPQDKVVLFTVRNLVQRMGLENLIIAFNQIVKKFAEIHLVIGGKGPLENGLVALTRSFEIENKVHFAGFITEEELPLYYQMADLFILPTKELEGFGLVTLEAMACGLPVVGTPIGGTKEILGKFNPQFIIDDTDPDSIAKLTIEKYHTIKANPQQWKEISDQCRQFVETHYSWKQNIDSLEQLFQRHIEK
jgi:glycosyltransferase involved in cell wall biosynthesis